ncbi:MAG: sulfotransferase [Hyphomicrobiaceae bacterium]
MTERMLNPIFVRGMSRSGGTLLCTLLDAHRDIAMSYELYPNLLETDGHVDLDLLARALEREKVGPRLERLMPSRSFYTFFSRCHRGGLETVDAARIVRQLAAEGQSLAGDVGRMRLVELCGLEKMHRLGKRRWGMKCNNRYQDYLAYWPDAQFFDMLRDGRDVLASQLNTGSFKHRPSEVGEAWVNTHERFEKFAEEHPRQFRMVRYENLTGEPDLELPAICAFLNLPMDQAMLRHHEMDLTVFKASHLSRDRVASSIDTTKIGRWKRDLSSDQLAEFMGAASDSLRKYGYS